MTLPVLVYDGGCGVCRRAMRWLHRRAGDRLELLPSDQLRNQRRLPQVDRDACDRAVQFVDQDQRVHQGAAAIVRALALVPGHGLPLYLYRFVPGARPLLERGYRAVADHRHRLGAAADLLAGRDGEPSTFAGSRRLFALALGLIVAVAFASLGWQWQQLLGDDGLWPVAGTLQAARNDMQAARYHGLDAWWLPTLFWWLPPSAAGWLWLLGAACGLLLAAGVWPRLMVAGALIAWSSYVYVGRDLLNQPGDVLLLELLLLALLLVPGGGLRPRWQQAPLPLLRWLPLLLLLRVSVATAAARLGSELPLADLLRQQLLTQPLPSALALWCARWPSWLLAPLGFAVVFGGLLLPWLLLLPRRLRHPAAALLLLIEAGWLASGTHGVAPLLLMCLLLLALDDQALRPLLPRRWRAGPAAGQPAPSGPAAVALGAAGALLLAGVAVQALWPGAALAREFDRLAIGHDYAEFGRVAHERRQLLVQASANGQSWHPYTTWCAPIDVERPPGYFVGHLPRIEWKLASVPATLQPGKMPPWCEPLAVRLLHASPTVLSAFAGSPFGAEPPAAVRFAWSLATPPDAAHWRAGWWWVRQPPQAITRPIRRGG